MARARGSPCPPLLPGRMSWPHGALLFLWLFSPPLGAGGGGVAMTSAAGGGSSSAPSCPAACSCSNQASRVICTRRELAEVPASIPVNTRYLNLQENSIQVSRPQPRGNTGHWGGRSIPPERARAFGTSPRPSPGHLRDAVCILATRARLSVFSQAPGPLSLPAFGAPGWDRLPAPYSTGQVSPPPGLDLESQVGPGVTLPRGLCAVCAVGDHMTPRLGFFI